MTHRVVLHGVLRDHLPAKYKKGFYLDFDDIRELISGAEQLLPIRELLDTYSAEFRIGHSVKTARTLTFDEVVYGQFKGITGDQQIKLHIIPGSDGDEFITMTMIYTALAHAAISVAVSLTISALFPPDQPDNSSDKRKSFVYANGVNQQKEGLVLPLVFGDDVLVPMNIISGGITTLQTGAASIRFNPGPGANGSGGVSHGGGGGLTGGNGPGGGGYINADEVGAENDAYRALLNLLTFGLYDELEGDGGSKGGKTMPNTMFSSNRIRLLGAVGVGPMGGLVGDTPREKLQHVYVNEIPLLSGNGVPSFNGVEIDTVLGEPGQRIMENTTNVEATFNVPQELIYADNLGQRVYYTKPTSPGVKTDLIRARLNATLLFTSKKGNQRPESVTVGCNVWREGQPEVHYGNWTVSGKTSEPCQFDLVVAAPPVAQGGSETDNWFFKFYRVTPDSTDDAHVIETAMQGWTEVQLQQLNYDGSTGCPPTALLSASIDNAQFGDVAVPSLTSRWRGYKCILPSVYNARTKTHTGVWNGTDTHRDYTSNPAYCWQTLATLREGSAGIPQTYIDKYNIKAVAEFCDEQVNGRPRFTLNKSFTDQEVTLDLLRDLAQTFRCYTYFDGRQLRLVPDKPGQTLSHFINNAGVVDGHFTYDTTPVQDRVNEVVVEWDNPADFFQTALVSYRDEAAVALLDSLDMPEQGVVRKRVYKIGCTNEAEAYDWARYLTYIAQHEHDAVTFNLLLGATGYEPGQLISVSDYRPSGIVDCRIEEVKDANTIVLDHPVMLTAGKSYTLYAQGPNGIVIKPIALVGASGSYTELTVSGHGLVEGTMCGAIDLDGVKPLIYRITNIQETAPAQYTVTATLHDEGKYAFVDEAVEVPSSPWTVQSQEPLPPPSEINIRPNSFQDPVLGSSHELVVSWPAVDTASAYLLEVASPDRGLQVLQQSPATTYTMTGCVPGPYVFTVKSINIAGASGQPQIKQWTISYDDEPENLAPAPVGEGFF